MANITIKVPAQYEEDVYQAFAEQYRYEPTLKDQTGNPYPNPETKEAFTKRIIAQFVRQTFEAYKIKNAAQLAAINEKKNLENINIT